MTIVCLNSHFRPVMSNLVVDETKRRKGYGRKLVAEAEAKIKDWGYKELILLVDQDNKKAQSFYRKVSKHSETSKCFKILHEIP